MFFDILRFPIDPIFVVIYFFLHRIIIIIYYLMLIFSTHLNLNRRIQIQSENQIFVVSFNRILNKNYNSLYVYLLIVVVFNICTWFKTI